MPCEVTTEQGERVVFVEEIEDDEPGEPFLFAITDRAVYFPGKERFAVRDPYVTIRVPLSEVREFKVAPLYSLGLLVVGLLLAAAGVARFVEDPASWHKLVGGLHLGAAGVLMLVGVLGRKSLVMRTVTGRHAWRRPLYAKKVGRERLEVSLKRVVESCRNLNIPAP